MKLYVLALLSVLVLAACSDSGDSKGGGPAPIRPEDFNPQAKPANPASKAYIQQVMIALDEAKQFHPEDAAFFSAIIENNEVKNIDYWTQQEALRKLDPAGRQLVDRIHQNCLLNPAQKTKTGDDGRSETATIVEKISMSSDGTTCPYVVKLNIDTNAQRSQKVNRESGVFSGSLTSTTVHREARELRDATVQSMTKLVSTSNESTINGIANGNGNFRTGEETMDANVTSRGYLKINFVDGSIQGPTISLLTMKSERSARGESKSDIEIRSKFEGKSPQGDIVIVTIANKEGSRTYLNGEEIGPSGIGKIGSFLSQEARQLSQSLRQAH